MLRDFKMTRVSDLMGGICAAMERWKCLGDHGG